MAARASSRLRSARWRGGLPRRGASKTRGRAVMAPSMVPLLRRRRARAGVTSLPRGGRRQRRAAARVGRGAPLTTVVPISPGATVAVGSAVGAGVVVGDVVAGDVVAGVGWGVSDDVDPVGVAVGRAGVPSSADGPRLLGTVGTGSDGSPATPVSGGCCTGGAATVGATGSARGARAGSTDAPAGRAAGGAAGPPAARGALPTSGAGGSPAGTHRRARKAAAGAR